MFPVSHSKFVLVFFYSHKKISQQDMIWVALQLSRPKCKIIDKIRLIGQMLITVEVISSADQC